MTINEGVGMTMTKAGRGNDDKRGRGNDDKRVRGNDGLRISVYREYTLRRRVGVL